MTSKDANQTPIKPLLLLILDGWGTRAPAADNAISVANTPNWDRLLERSVHTTLQTSGEAVGLPAGQMGNSEVGHMNIGAGRVVFQDLVRISHAFKQGTLAEHQALQQVVKNCADNNQRIHLMGLVSAGGVHSHEQHLLDLLPLLTAMNAGEIIVHAFLDGRDTPPRSARESLEKLQHAVNTHPRVRLATVSGRFYAMDRDNRWDRVEQAWQAVVHANAKLTAESAIDALEQAYARDENDEFVQPTLINDGCAIDDGDAVLMFNFRADRARQMARAFVEPGFSDFDTRRPQLAQLVTMTEYLDNLPALVLFPPEPLPDLLGEVLAKAGCQQLRIAETEKYAHVTFFFNGGQETPFDNEARQLVPSPKVRTYDLQPEMSAPELTRQLRAAIAGQQFDVIVCNVANADMVGHSGVFSAAVKAVEAVDDLLGQVSTTLDEVGGEMLVTADHGNIEQMRDAAADQAHTAHTVNPVPLLYHGPRNIGLEAGRLCDIAPSMLALLQLEQPASMTGQSLVAISE